MGCLNAPLSTLRRKADELSHIVDELEPPECKHLDKASYKIVNTIMTPLLRKQGYRSLAHFERNPLRRADVTAGQTAPLPELVATEVCPRSG